MLSQKMISYLKRQLEHEIKNSIIYRNISQYLDVKGFKNLSKYYKDWSSEESKHATWVQEFLESMNIYIDYDVNCKIDLGLETSLLKFVELTVKTEEETTKMLAECLTMSYNEDPLLLTTVFIQDTMLKEQIEEMDKASTLYDQLKNIGENSALLQLYDNDFGD